MIKRRTQKVRKPNVEQLERITLLSTVQGGTPDYFGGTPNWAWSPQPTATTDTGTGAVTISGGIQKFVDALPGIGAANANEIGQYISVAVPDTTSYPGCDYYEIAAVQFTERLGRDLKPTTLRGYVQIETPSNFSVSQHVPLKYPDGSPILNYLGTQVYAVDPPMLFGAEIVAQENRPVRVTFDNYLPTGETGDLFLPVDSTVQGAGSGPGTATKPSTVNVTAVDRVGTTGTTIEVTTASANGFQIGDLVNFSAMEPVDYVGNFRVTRVVDATHFQVSIYEYPGTPALTLGTVGEAYTQNRVGIHLHGGVTPWISDGTANQWITPTGENATYPTGVSTVNVPDMASPPPGSTTFYYTNQQSARLMFYHDHSLGLTRLNVYAGLESGYLLTDAVEQNLINAGILPDTGTVLVLQDKTFIDPKTVLTTDPTWPIALNMGNSDLWTSHVWMPNQNPNDISGANGYGRWDYGAWFWPPWVTMYTQIQGAGGITITDGGSGYTQTPVVTITAAAGDTGVGARAHAILDKGVVTGIELDYPGTGYSLPPIITITPAPGDTPVTQATADSSTWYYPNVPNISQTMEAYQDTAMVNGTVYPYVNVDPKTYRYQLLNGCDDRMLNLQMYTSSSIVNTITITNPGSGYIDPPLVTITAAPGDTTGLGATATADIDPDTGAVTGISFITVGSGYTLPPIVTLTASPTGDTTTATTSIYSGTSEVGMVPAVPNSMQFPASWKVQTLGQVGDILDGRQGGIPDPRTIGPAFIQIGNEGGFLPTPTVISSTPIGFERNPKNIVIGNVSQHGLLIGPAERADVLIDFSKFAGKTVILYNDAPAGFPAADSRVDYFTNDADQSSSGGTVSTLAGYGPNTRTFMVFHVAATTPTSPAPQPYDMGKLTAAFKTTGSTPGVFKADQMPPIVPSSTYNSAYGTSFPVGPAGVYSKIADTAMTFNPVDLTQANSLSKTPITINMQPKAIQETFEMTYGRMMANLGVEIPNTNGTNQTTISYVMQDPATEIIDGVAMSPVTANDGTQLWKITHNGVDTHTIHFHLFNVQLVNRVAWDGQVRGPDANELGWKETLRMNPLEDTIVAMKAVAPRLPFDIPDSIHALDPTQPIGAMMGFTNIAPDGTPVTVTNQIANFGWEYMWHCHVLSHEEMMMMRPINVIVPSAIPIAPTLLTPILTDQVTSAPVLSWQDGTPVLAATTMGNPANEIGFTIMRAPYDPNTKIVGTYVQVGTTPANATTFTDTTATTGYYNYQVIAYNKAGTAASNIVEGQIYGQNSTVTQVSTSNATGWYSAGKAISIQLTFDDVETVTGSPTLLLNNGATAIYASGSGTNTLAFSYVVAAGSTFDITTLDYSGITALALSGGTIIGQRGLVPAALILPAVASAADLLFNNKIGIDTTLPVVKPPADLTSPLTDSTGAIVTFTGSAEDLGSGIATTSFSTSSGSHFAVGVTTVTYTATDVAGNIASAKFTVTVLPVGVLGTELVVLGTAGNDTISVNAASPTSVAVTMNRLTVPGSPFTVPLGTTVHVYGLAGNDSISMQGAVTGILDGGTGTNTFDVGQWTASAGTIQGNVADTVIAARDSSFTISNTALTLGGTTLSMSGVTNANLTGGVSNNTFVLTNWAGSASLNGGGGTDSVVDTNDANFTLTNTLLTVGSQSITLASIGSATLTGGSSSNLFNITGWTGPATLVGGGGTDTLIDTSDSNFILTNNLLTVGTQSIALSAITSATLTGGSSANTFTLTGWTGGGTLTGGGGTDTLIDTSNSNFTLTDNSLTVGINPTIALSAIASANLTGGASANTFTLTGWTGGGSLIGGGGTDTVIDTSDSNFTLTNSSLFVGTQLIALSGVTAATLTGGTSNNSFTVSGWTGTGSLTGGGGVDSVVASKNANLTITDTNITSSDGLNMTLKAITADTLTLSSITATRSINASAFTGSSALAVTGSGAATLTGGSGSDTFTITGYNGRGTLIGGGGGGTDTLIDTSNSNFTLTNSLLTAGNQSVTLSAIGVALLTGGTGNNSFTITGWSGSGSLTGGGGTDTVVKTSNSDFVLKDNSLTVGGSQIITLSAIGRATLTGGTSNNTFTITGWSGAATLTGGGGTDTLVDSSSSNFVLTDTSLTIGAQAITLSAITVANLTGTGNNSFTVSNWTGAGTLTYSGTGTGTLIATKNVDLTLSNSSLVASDGLNVTLSGITADILTLNNGTGTSRTINASAFSGVSTLVASGAGQAKLLGGSGNDTLSVTGSGAAVLVGNGGNDTLLARGNGRVIEIGGSGADTMSSSGGSAGNGQTIQISGSTIYDNNLAALDAVLSAWASTTNTYTQRVAGLTTGANVTGGYKFDATTIIDDGVINTLTNTATSNNGQNWFLVRTRDIVTKRTSDVRTNL